MKEEEKKQPEDLEKGEGLKVFIRQVVREEVKRLLDEQLRTRGWQEVKRPGPQEHK